MDSYQPVPDLAGKALILSSYVTVQSPTLSFTSRHMFTPTSEAAFGKGGILRLRFRKTGRHTAALTLEQMCSLFYLKRATGCPRFAWGSQDLVMQMVRGQHEAERLATCFSCQQGHSQREQAWRRSFQSYQHHTSVSQNIWETLEEYTHNHIIFNDYYQWQTQKRGAGSSSSGSIPLSCKKWH